jgi:hypothetical protein
MTAPTDNCKRRPSLGSSVNPDPPAVAKEKRGSGVSATHCKRSIRTRESKESKVFFFDFLCLALADFVQFGDIWIWLPKPTRRVPPDSAPAGRFLPLGGYSFTAPVRLET